MIVIFFLIYSFPFFLFSFTALHYAVERSDEALVDFLVQCPKIDLETLNYQGRTALEITQKVPLRVMQLLRERGVPSPYYSEDEDDLDDSDDEVSTFFNLLFNIYVTLNVYR